MKHAHISILAAAALVAGCASAPIEVNDSQLNWIKIKYQPATAGQDAKPCQIDLIGAGSIEFKEGLSPRVTDSFSQDTGNAHWNDFHQEKLGVPPDIIRGWMQIFVDAGLMDKSKSKPHGRGEKRDIAVFHANINRELAICITDDEELLGHVRRLVSIIKNDGGREKQGEPEK